MATETVERERQYGGIHLYVRQPGEVGGTQRTEQRHRPEGERRGRARHPLPAMSPPSTMTWRSIVQRLAPSAARRANSPSLAVARVSSRLATFAQAMSSTSPTAPMSRSRAGSRMLHDVVEERARPGCGDSTPRAPGAPSRNCSAMRFISACACAHVTPWREPPVDAEPRVVPRRRAGRSRTGAGPTGRRPSP